MCTTPKKFGEQQVACRECDQCISTRKNTWVARCMAEKAVAGEALVFTLTYAPLPNGEDPIGARVFRYADVQKFMKRIRNHYTERYSKVSDISMLVAGEIGSKGTKRVHWHMILFAGQPLGKLGKWSDKDKKAIKEIQFSTLGKKNRVHWSLWPHGHVNVLEPDQKGMNYVLKYALKDQFNVVKSRNHARYAKAENHAASMFRMSKNPPIGMRFLKKKCDEWENERIVPLDLNVRVPGYSGYWFLQGEFRQYLRNRLKFINELRRKETGKDTPTWATLLSNVSGNVENITVEIEESSDWEGLQYGNTSFKETGQAAGAQDTGAEQRYYNAKTEGRANVQRAHTIARRCGNIQACTLCKASRTQADNRELEADENYWLREWVQRGYGSASEKARFRAWWRKRGRASRGCHLRDTGEIRNALRAVAGIDKLARKIKPEKTKGRE